MGLFDLLAAAGIDPRAAREEIKALIRETVKEIEAGKKAEPLKIVNEKKPELALATKAEQDAELRKMLFKGIEEPNGRN